MTVSRLFNRVAGDGSVAGYHAFGGRIAGVDAADAGGPGGEHGVGDVAEAGAGGGFDHAAAEQDLLAGAPGDDVVARVACTWEK